MPLIQNIGHVSVPVNGKYLMPGAKRQVSPDVWQQILQTGAGNLVVIETPVAAAKQFVPPIPSPVEEIQVVDMPVIADENPKWTEGDGIARDGVPAEIGQENVLVISEPEVKADVSDVSRSDKPVAGRRTRKERRSKR